MKININLEFCSIDPLKRCQISELDLLFGIFQYTAMDIFYCIGDFIFMVCKFEFLIWKRYGLINIEICNGAKEKYLNDVNVYVILYYIW